MKDKSMHTRRRFIEILPLAGLSALVACGDKTTTPQPAAPAPTGAPAVVATPDVAPSPMPPAAPAAVAVPGPMVDPSEAMAVSLGYVTDAKTTKDAKHVAGAACANCALYGGKAGEASGPCPLYAGKQVAAAGWCTGYVKKA
jgi:hypothetical protein